MGQSLLQTKKNLRYREYELRKAKFADIRECLERVTLMYLMQINQMAPKPRSIPIPAMISTPFLLTMNILGIVIQFLLFLLNRKIPVINTSLIRISSTAQQLNLRLEQFLFWPKQYSVWYSSENKQTPLAQAQYVGFFNTFWLIANDVIIGTIVKAMIIEKRLVITRLLKALLKVSTCFIEGLWFRICTFRGHLANSMASWAKIKHRAGHISR